VLVNIGVIVLRRTKPDMERGYRVPFVPVFPIIGVGLCLFLMKFLEAATWFRFLGWLVLGLIVYGLRIQALQAPERDLARVSLCCSDGLADAPARERG
jgi:basic amino acid/polyamine antiporter, APA family